MRKRVSKYIFILAAIFMATIIIGLAIWNKPHANIKDAVAIGVTADELYSVLSNKKAYAKSSYVNRIVAVTGKVVQVMQNRQKQQVMLLQTHTDGGYVNCTIEENIDNIKQGDTITIKGICIGYSDGDNDIVVPGDVILVRCYRS